MAKLTKKQFEEVFRSEVLPYVIARERAGFPDKPARREAWNNTVDSYIRDRQLPETAGDWGHPRWLKTWSPKRTSANDYATKRRASTKKSPTQLDREIDEALSGRRGHATKTDRRKTRYVLLSWSDPQNPYPSLRHREGNFPVTIVHEVLEGLFQSGIPEVHVEGRDFPLTSYDDVYKASAHADKSVAGHRR